MLRVSILAACNLKLGDAGLNVLHQPRKLVTMTYLLATVLDAKDRRTQIFAKTKQNIAKAVAQVLEGEHLFLSIRLSEYKQI